MTGLSIPGEHAAVTDSALRAKLNRQAKEIAPMLPGAWIYYVTVGAGGASARVVFAETAGPGRIVIAEDGRLASISVTDRRLGRRVAGALRRGAWGNA